MKKTRTNKNGTVSIIGLTELEFQMIYECVSRCQDFVKWDDKLGYAEDGGNFLWMIDDREEYEVLQNLDLL